MMVMLMVRLMVATTRHNPVECDWRLTRQI